jgi:hypothetical protein
MSLMSFISSDYIAGCVEKDALTEMDMTSMGFCSTQYQGLKICISNDKLRNSILGIASSLNSTLLDDTVLV